MTLPKWTQSVSYRFFSFCSSFSTTLTASSYVMIFAKEQAKKDEL